MMLHEIMVTKCTGNANSTGKWSYQQLSLSSVISMKIASLEELLETCIFSVLGILSTLLNMTGL
jgi:hypothetical protein